jgi:hypothetical protein
MRSGTGSITLGAMGDPDQLVRSALDLADYSTVAMVKALKLGIQVGQWSARSAEVAEDMVREFGEAIRKDLPAILTAAERLLKERANPPSGTPTRQTVIAALDTVGVSADIAGKMYDHAYGKPNATPHITVASVSDMAERARDVSRMLAEGKASPQEIEDALRNKYGPEIAQDLEALTAEGRRLYFMGGGQHVYAGGRPAVDASGKTVYGKLNNDRDVAAFEELMHPTQPDRLRPFIPIQYDRTLAGYYIPRYKDSQITSDERVIHGGPHNANLDGNYGKVAVMTEGKSKATRLSQRVAEADVDPIGIIFVGDIWQARSNRSFVRLYLREVQEDIRHGKYDQKYADKLVAQAAAVVRSNARKGDPFKGAKINGVQGLLHNIPEDFGANRLLMDLLGYQKSASVRTIARDNGMEAPPQDSSLLVPAGAMILGFTGYRTLDNGTAVAAVRFRKDAPGKVLASAIPGALDHEAFKWIQRGTLLGELPYSLHSWIIFKDLYPHLPHSAYRNKVIADQVPLLLNPDFEMVRDAFSNPKRRIRF